MDTNLTILIVVLLLAAVAIVYALRFRGSGRISFTAPFGINMKAEGRNPTAAAPGKATVEDVVAGGNVRATAQGDAEVRHAKAKGDIEATSGESAPKA